MFVYEEDDAVLAGVGYERLDDPTRENHVALEKFSLHGAGSRVLAVQRIDMEHHSIEQSLSESHASAQARRIKSATNAPRSSAAA